MRAPDWIDVMAVDELRRRRRTAVNHGELQLCLLWHPDEDRPVAFDDVCIHKQRNLSKGVVLNGRIVCPGHQWAYDLTSGYCKERDRYQPTYRVDVVDGRVLVDLAGPLPTGTTTEAPSGFEPAHTAPEADALCNKDAGQITRRREDGSQHLTARSFDEDAAESPTGGPRRSPPRRSAGRRRDRR